jgi:hypothetical protein
MAFLTRDEFLALPLRHEDVEVRGGTLRVWELSAAQLIEVETSGEDMEPKDRGVAFAAMCLGDEAGPFSPPITIAEMKTRAGSALKRVIAAAQRLSVTSAEAAEEIRGN